MPLNLSAQLVNGPLQTAAGNLYPFGADAFYVGTPVGPVPTWMANRLRANTNSALDSCRSGVGDVIQWLPGYTESIATADAWSNLGTKTDITLMGTGNGTNRAAITWTTATSTMLMDAANFRILNARLFLAGAHAAGAALTVAAPITISAPGWVIDACDIFWGFDADQIVTIGITTTAAATSGKFNNNFCYANAAAVPTTTFLRLTGTDFLEIDNTTIIGPGSTVAIGPVQQLTTGSLGQKITRSRFQSTLAASTHSFTAIAGCTGIVDKCAFGVLAAAPANGITTGSGLQVTASYVANAGAAGALATG